MPEAIAGTPVQQGSKLQLADKVAQRWLPGRAWPPPLFVRVTRYALNFLLDVLSKRRKFRHDVVGASSEKAAAGETCQDITLFGWAIRLDGQIAIFHQSPV